MPTREHLVLCGGVEGPKVGGRATVRLDLHGPRANVKLSISDIARKLLVNIPDRLVDLLEIATYVYAADGAISRGGKTDSEMGARWRRTLRFKIPVREPTLWGSEPVSAALTETLSFLSDEQYAFDFEPFHSPPSLANYFDFPATEHTTFAPEEVVLFSGGLDSLGGAVEEVLGRGKRVALVSHRSAAKISSVQKYLVDLLSSRARAESVLHVPVLATLTEDLNREPTHRARSFLFAALGAVTARLFGVNCIRFFENGIVSLNLPPVRQVVGARATRTTHPQALAGFRRIFGAVFNRDFDVTNPFMWLTKPEVIGRIALNGCGDLIPHTRSCTRVRDMTTLHPHCGQCSQCIDRRFAILAAGQEHDDPPDAYKVDLFTGARSEGPDREMALAYVRSASEVDRMADEAFFARFGEVSRVVGYFPEPADVVATRVLELHRRHASSVCGVFDQAVALNASALRQGTLASGSLLVLKVSRLERAQTLPEPSQPDLSLPAVREIRLAADRGTGRIIFERWGPIKGAGAKLLSALLAEFDHAAEEKLAPEHYPFVSSRVLARQLACDSDETLRRQVLRLRNSIRGLAESAGEPAPDDDALIENQPGRGYRLNPNSVRVVQVAELRRSEEVTPARPKRHASRPLT